MAYNDVKTAGLIANSLNDVVDVIPVSLGPSDYLFYRSLASISICSWRPLITGAQKLLLKLRRRLEMCQWLLHQRGITV